MSSLRKGLEQFALPSSSFQTLGNPIIWVFSILQFFLTLLSFLPFCLRRSLMEQLRRLQALFMNTSNKPAQTGTCVLVRTSSVRVCQADKSSAQTLHMTHFYKKGKRKFRKTFVKDQFKHVRNGQDFTKDTNRHSPHKDKYAVWTHHICCLWTQQWEKEQDLGQRQWRRNSKKL